MKKENNVSASKKLTILALVLFLIFVAINVFWIITMYIPYCGYKYSLADADEKYPTLVTGKQEGKYFFKISETPYLGYDDYIRVGIEISSDTKGIGILGLNIYPNIWGDYEYFVDCMEDGNSGFMFEITEHGDFIPYDENYSEINEKAQQALKEKNAEIMEFMKIAKDTWGLEAKHDLKAGLKSLFTANPVITIFSLLPLILPSLVIVWLIWKLKVKIPFQQLNCELDNSYGSKELNYKRVVENYEFSASNPQIFRNNGFLAVQKLPYEEERLTLVIFPDKKKEKTKYYALLAGPKTVIRKAEKVEFEYACGKALSSDQFIIDHNEELADLAVQANLFWPI